MDVCYRVAVEGVIVEGEKLDKDFPGNAEIAENVDSIDNLIESIRYRWGVNASIELYIWAKNYQK